MCGLLSRISLVEGQEKWSASDNGSQAGALTYELLRLLPLAPIGATLRLEGTHGPRPTHCHATEAAF